MGKTKKKNITIKVSAIKYSNMIRQAKGDMQYRNPKVTASAVEASVKEQIEEVIEKYLRKWYSR